MIDYNIIIGLCKSTNRNRKIFIKLNLNLEKYLKYDRIGLISKKMIYKYTKIDIIFLDKEGDLVFVIYILLR